jgi:hypothetical protein
MQAVLSNTLWGAFPDKPKAIRAYWKNCTDGMQPLFESDTEMLEYRPHHVGWRIYRDSHKEWCGTEYYEWVTGNSWSGTKIVRPSYDRDCAVTLHVRIQGKRDKTGRWRPWKWLLHLALGQRHEERGGAVREGWSGYCRSLEDAKRRIDKVDIDAEVEALVRKIYSTQNRKVECIYSKVGEQWKPYVTLFSIGWDDLNDSRRGGAHYGAVQEFLGIEYRYPMTGSYGPHQRYKGRRHTFERSCHVSSGACDIDVIANALGSWVDWQERQDSNPHSLG